MRQKCLTYKVPTRLLEEVFAESNATETVEQHFEHSEFSPDHDRSWLKVEKEGCLGIAQESPHSPYIFNVFIDLLGTSFVGI